MASETRPDPADALPPDTLADLLSPAPTGISPQELPATMGERYEVRGLLGEGGQGVVLAVRDRRLDREIAAKVPRKGLPGAEIHLEREAKLAASLEHPNILPTYDLAEAPDGAPLLLMRRAPGRSLEEVLRACERPTGVATGALSGLSGRAARLRVFLQLAEAISYAHSRGVLHLDLKPANVRVGEYGEVFVMDWGLARRITDSAAPVGGTPPYMAPEMFEGLSPDERADVYSLGVTLYRMLSGGALPYDADVSTTENYRSALERLQRVPLAERAADLDPDLAAVVDKACDLDRQKRYRKVRELVADVEAALDGRPVSARQAPWPELAAKWAARHRRALAYAAVALVLATVSGAFLWKEKLNRDERRRLAAANRLRARARVPFDKGWELALRMPPDHGAAEGHFSRALKIDPGFAEAYYARGRCRQSLGRFEKALGDLLQAARLDPSLIMARYHAGKIYMEHRREFENAFEKAGEQFVAMREVDPDNEYSLLGEAWLATVAGKWSDALALADRAARLAEVDNLRGYVYSSGRSPLRDDGKAVAAYTRYLVVLPHNVTALNNRAYALIRLGRMAEAERDLDRALGLDPDYLYALTQRGYLRTTRGDLPGALRDLDRAQKQNPGYVWVYLNRGTVYKRLGALEKAREDYVTATGLEPGNPVAYRRRAFMELGAGEFETALRLYEEALELSPPKARHVVRRQRGLAAYYAGRLEDAARTWKTDVAARPAGKRLYTGLLLWRVLVETGKEKEAGELLGKLAGDEREKPHLRVAARFCLGEASELEVLEEAEGLGALCESFYYLGAAQLARGRLVEAKHLLEACRLMGRLGFTEHLLAGLELDFLEPAGAPGEKGGGGEGGG